MRNEAAVIPRLLGADFGRLDPPLQVMHGGESREYWGTASVERGKGWLASLMCSIGGLPQSVADTPFRFKLEVVGQSEIWTRYFSGSAPMVSRVWSANEWLVERLGPATLRFTLCEREGVLHWRAVGLSVLGVPIPGRAFDFQAHVRGLGARYRFEIDARMPLIGRLIRYHGVLDVVS